MQARSIDQTQCQSYGLCSRLKAPSHVHLLGRIFQLGCGKGQSHRKRAHDARRSGTGSRLTLPRRHCGALAAPSVQLDDRPSCPTRSTGLSFLESDPAKSASCVDTRNCRRSFVRLKRSTNPATFMSSELYGPSKMATGNGGFGMPILRAQTRIQQAHLPGNWRALRREFRTSCPRSDRSRW